jgi:Uma2 family endonuclease
MGVIVHRHRHSYDDYLAVEAVSTVKHEFLDGEIYAMAGGSVRHAALSAAVLAALHGQLHGRCRVFSSDLRVRVLATGLASYADAAVVCGAIETDPAHAETVTNPTALVEVLSPGTIDYDLGEKFEHYRQMPSLQAVLHVWQDTPHLELRQRSSEGVWQTHTVGPGESISIRELGCSLAVDALYAGA